MNTPVFKLNNRVMALTSTPNDRAQVREKGKIYTVTGIMYCPTDGHQAININSQRERSRTNMVDCNCGKEHPSSGRSWTKSTEFVKVDEQTLEALVEAEEYELAAIIHKELKEHDQTRADTHTKPTA